MFNDKESFKSAFLERLETMHGKSIDETTDMDKLPDPGNDDPGIRYPELDCHEQPV